MASGCPESLKVIQPFLKLTKEYENRDAVIAYWSRYYAVQVGIKNKTKDNISFLMNLMDTLEQSKKNGSQEEAITNDIVAQAHLENKGTQLFLWADTEDRSSRFTKNVVKSFYSASLIFDILNVFGELNDEILGQRKYAKWKAAYINNCLKKGETPIPGPVGEDVGIVQPPANNAGLPYPPSNNVMPNLPPSVVYPPQQPGSVIPQQPGNVTYIQPSGHVVSQQFSQPQVPQVDPKPNPPSTSAPFKPLDYTKAQKYCKYAASALQYEDVPTAIDNLQKALKLLQTGEDG